MLTAPEAVQRVLQNRLQRAMAGRAEAAASAAPVVDVKKTVSPLARLNQSLAADTQAGPDLRSAMRFQETWSRICAEDDVTEAVQRGPENAGPLNSHRLVLRTLGIMRDLSPDYLRRFMTHADTLLWLEQAHGRLKEPPGKTKPAKAGRVKR